MSSSSSVGARLRRLITLLATLVLVPLTVVLAAAPAHATAFTAEGSVYDAVGDPVSSVTVDALSSPGFTAVAKTATTDAGGGYALSALAAGTYHLRYTRTGFTTAYLGGGPGVDVVVDADGDITVDGEPAEDNLLEDVTLADATGDATISGQVNTTAAGNAGLGGITVQVFDEGDTAGTAVATTTTATSGTVGSWSIGTLRIGTYDIRFSGTSGGSSYDVTYYGGTTPETTTPVKVGQSNVVSVDGSTKAAGALGTTSMTKSSASTPHPVSGEVDDANGDPIDGVLVTPSGGPTGTTATTASGGLYTLQLTPGTYTLTYTKSGFTTATYPASVTVALDGTVTPSSTLDAVTLNQNAGTTTISGLVNTTAAGNAGLGGITVAVFNEGDTAGTAVATTTTATSGTVGSWTVGTLKIGTYDIRFSGSSGGSSYDVTYYGGTTPETTTPVKVGQSNVVTVGGSTKAAGALGTTSMTKSSASTPHAVSGEVDDANGDPIDGVLVSPSGGPTGTTATTDVDGLYTLQLTPGTYTLTYTKSGFTSTGYTSNVVVALDGAVTPSSTLDPVTLADSTGDATIFGQVNTTAAGNAGLGGITVEVFDEGDTAGSVVATTTTATSGTVGSWSIGTLKIGTYDIRFSGSSGGSSYDVTYYGGSTPETTTPVKVGQSNVVTVGGFTKAAGALGTTSMTKSSSDTLHPVSGEVDDANGDPINGVLVTPSGGPTGTTATTDIDGLYTLQLKPGTYQLGYTKGGYTASTYPGSGEATQTITVQLDGIVKIGSTTVPGGVLDSVTLNQNPGTTTISGQVNTTAAGNAGLGGITVEVFDEGDTAGSVVATTTTATSGTVGSWTVSALKIGTYDIRFSGSSGGSSYDVTYYGGATTDTTTPVKVGQSNVVSVDGITKAGGALGTTSMTKSSSDTLHPVSGEVDDANGDPISGVLVSPSGGPTATTATTDADGLYTLQLKPGTYQLGYTKSGYTTSTYPGSGEATQTITVQLDGTVKIGTTTVPGGVLDAVALEQSTGTTTISGKVTSSGTGVGGITVEVFPEGDLSDESLVATTTTASSGTVGSWSVGTLKIGTYTVRFTDNVAAAPSYVQKTLGPIRVAQGNNVYLDDVFQPSGALGDTAIVESDADTLHPIIGDVYDANFDALEDVTVTAEPQSGSPAADPVTTDSDGAYTLQVKAGTYKIHFAKDGFSPKYYLNDNDAQALVVVSDTGVVKILNVVVPDNTLDSVELASTTTTPLSGTVVDEGDQPIGGIKVRATKDGETVVAVEATTASNGAFTLQLPVGTYTIAYVDVVAAAPTYITGHYGGDTPRLVKVATGGAITDADTGDAITDLGSVALAESNPDTTYDITGYVYDENYDGLDGATVRVLPVGKTDDSAALYTGTTGPDEAEDPSSGFYRIPVKAGSYWLKYSAPGKATTYLIDYDTYGPVTVKVAATGAITAHGYDFTANQIDDVQLLLPAAAFATAPKLSGKVLVGQTVTTSFGTLQGATINKNYMTIEWFLDGKPADDYSLGNFYEKFKVPLVAATKKLSYRITIDDPDGYRASSVFTSTPVAVPKAAATLRTTYKKGKLSVTLMIPGMPKPTGTIVVKDGKKKFISVKVTRRSKKGTVAVKLTKLKPGKHTLTLAYAGTKTIGAATVKVKVKIPKKK